MWSRSPMSHANWRGRRTRDRSYQALQGANSPPPGPDLAFVERVNAAKSAKFGHKHIARAVDRHFMRCEDDARMPFTRRDSVAVCTRRLFRVRTEMRDDTAGF